MKMTRKILALLLSVVMVLSLAACGKQNDGTNTGNNTNTGDDANNGDTTAKVTLQVAYENNPGEPIDDAVNKWKELVDEPTAPSSCSCSPPVSWVPSPI